MPLLGLTSVDENSTPALTSPRTLTTMCEESAECHCRANNLAYGTTCHSCLRHHHPPQIDSATTFLFKKAASMIWRMVKEIDWDEGARALAELHALVSSAISLHFYSLVQALHVVSDFGSDCSYYGDYAQDGNEVSPRRITPFTSVDYLSSREPITTDIEVASSLTFQSSVLSANDSNRCLDYIVTQSDVTQLNDFVKGGSSSSSSNNNNIPQIHISTMQQDDESFDENSLVCSSCHDDDDEDVEDFLLRNADIIEDYIANSENSSEVMGEGLQLIGDLPQFSWMVVPTDINEELKRQWSRSSIDTEDHDSKISCFNTPTTFDDDGVFCQVPTQGDEGGGDRIRDLVILKEENDANEDEFQAKPSSSPSPIQSSPSSKLHKLGYIILSGLRR